jgi:uncharacterized surface protein with fasciclin (FAS1) repeats
MQLLTVVLLCIQLERLLASSLHDVIGAVNRPFQKTLDNLPSLKKFIKDYPVMILVPDGTLEANAGPFSFKDIYYAIMIPKHMASGTPVADRLTLGMHSTAWRGGLQACTLPKGVTQRLTVTQGPDGSMWINQQHRILRSYLATNGMVHVTDTRVRLPDLTLPPALVPDVKDTTAFPEFMSTLRTLINLKGANLTLFVPMKGPEFAEAWEQCAKEPKLRRKFVLSHVVRDNSLFSEQFLPKDSKDSKDKVAMKKFKSAAEEDDLWLEFSVSKDDGSYTVNGQQVMAQDIPMAFGVAHVIEGPVVSITKLPPPKKIENDKTDEAKPNGPKDNKQPKPTETGPAKEKREEGRREESSPVKIQPSKDENASTDMNSGGGTKIAVFVVVAVIVGGVVGIGGFLYARQLRKKRRLGMATA